MTDFPSSPETATLKPCPFCGGPAKLADWSSTSSSGAFDVYCANDATRCVTMEDFDSEEEVAAAWNRRDGLAQPAPSSPVTETLADEIASLSGRCSMEADRIACIKAATILRSFGHAQPAPSSPETATLWAAIRQRDANINAAFTAINAIEAQLHEMRSLKGWRLNLIRENLEKTKAALRVPTGLAQNSKVREALQECIDVLALCEHPRSEDPQYGHEVAALGDRIGYGALMSSASATWRRRLKEDGNPVGGEFVAGPCQATVTRSLQMARAALSDTSTVRTIETGPVTVNEWEDAVAQSSPEGKS